MKRINQTVIHKGIGNCRQAAVASLLGLELKQVPNFILYGENWFVVYSSFMLAHGWDCEGTCRKEKPRGLRIEDSINGFFDAGVPSRTFKDVYHAVILNRNGTVVHDPNPNKLWLGENIYKLDTDAYWTTFTPVLEKDFTLDHFNEWHFNNAKKFGVEKIIYS